MAYEDPCTPSRVRPSLVRGLLQKPSTPTVSRLEDQTTVVLAWLLDRWPRFARAFVASCLEDDEEALHALDSTAVIGARTWRPLPKLPCSPGPGLMYPDISVTGDSRSFELIIENKIDAEPHLYDCPLGCHARKIVQHEAYALALGRVSDDDPREALVRRVSVLSRDAVPAGTDLPTRGRDIRWRDVHELIADLKLRRQVDGGVLVVADEFAEALGAGVLAQQKQVIADPLLVKGLAVLRRLLPLLEAGVGGLASVPSYYAAPQYVGGFLRFSGSEGSEHRLWVMVTRSGAKYSVAGSGDGLWVVKDGVWSEGAVAALLAGGFTKQKAVMWEAELRKLFPLDCDADPEWAATGIGDTLLPTLSAARDAA